MLLFDSDGDFRDPDELGSYAANVGHYAGGRIRISASWLRLDTDARISARGRDGGSGGTVSLNVDGGEVSGAGVIDVSVRHSSSYGGGGGRVAVLGYSVIDPDIVKNVRMEGDSGDRAGAGTFFHKASCVEAKPGQCNGHLVIRSPDFRASYDTPISYSGTMDTVELSRVQVKWSASSTLTISAHKIQDSNVQFTSTAMTIFKMDLKVLDIFILGGQLVVEGNVEVPSSKSLQVQSSLHVKGNLDVAGSLISDSSGVVRVDGDATFTSTTTFNRKLEVKGSLFLDNVKLTVNKEFKVDQLVRLRQSSANLQLNMDMSSFGDGCRVGELDVEAGAILTFAGVHLTVDRNATVAANSKITHDRTSNKQHTIDLKVGGGLWVKGSGQINVDEKSSYRHEGRGMSRASHGGKGSDGYATCECVRFAG